jgi:hypothetical protein
MGGGARKGKGDAWSPSSSRRDIEVSEGASFTLPKGIKLWEKLLEIRLIHNGREEERRNPMRAPIGHENEENFSCF